MKYLIVIIFLICASLEPIGFSHDLPTIGHFTYMFFHASIIHLILNSLAYIAVFRIIEKSVKHWKILLYSYVGAVLSGILATKEMMTVGSSGMVYVMIGMFYALILSNDLKVVDSKKLNTFTFVIILSLMISYFKPNSNFELHVYALIFGILWYIPRTIYRSSSLVSA